MTGFLLIEDRQRALDFSPPLLGTIRPLARAQERFPGTVLVAPRPQQAAELHQRRNDIGSRSFGLAEPPVQRDRERAITGSLRKRGRGRKKLSETLLLRERLELEDQLPCARRVTACRIGGKKPRAGRID